MLAGGVTSGEGGWKARERARRQAAVECALCVCVCGGRGGMGLGPDDASRQLLAECCRHALGCVLAAQWSSGDICESSPSLKLACSSHSAHVLGSRIFRNRVLNKIYRTLSPLPGLKVGRIVFIVVCFLRRRRATRFAIRGCAGLQGEPCWRSIQHEPISRNPVDLEPTKPRFLMVSAVL